MIQQGMGTSQINQAQQPKVEPQMTQQQAENEFLQQGIPQNTF
jgi:hypothetical protein